MSARTFFESEFFHFRLVPQAFPRHADADFFDFKGSAAAAGFAQLGVVKGNGGAGKETAVDALGKAHGAVFALQRSLRFQLQSVVFGQAVERGIGADIDGGEYQRAVSKDADPFAVGVDKCVHGCNTVSEQIHSSIKAAAAADGVPPADTLPAV